MFHQVWRKCIDWLVAQNCWLVHIQLSFRNWFKKQPLHLWKNAWMMKMSFTCYNEITIIKSYWLLQIRRWYSSRSSTANCLLGLVNIMTLKEKRTKYTLPLLPQNVHYLAKVLYSPAPCMYTVHMHRPWRHIPYI